MNRRGFLHFIGVFSAGAALPAIFAAEKIVRAPVWAKDLPKIIYRTSPLAAGKYTFSAYAGELGIYIGGVTATGGETLFEIPETHELTDPRLIGGGLILRLEPFEKSIDFTDAAVRERLVRGNSVNKA